jgi:hypothetical protein
MHPILERGHPGPTGGSTDTVVVARGLRSAYGDNVAVDGVDLQVRPGEIFGLLGPNGAGKTTTVECLQGSGAAAMARCACSGSTPTPTATSCDDASAPSFRPRRCPTACTSARRSSCSPGRAMTPSRSPN